jgi:hypothetical protein
MIRRRKEESLARAADGTLPESRRRELAGELEASPELARELELQDRALTLMQQLNAEQAPAELHATVHSLVAAKPAPRPQRRRTWRLAPAAAVAVAVLALVAVLLSSNGSSAPTVSQAALLALRSPTQPPPAESPSRVPVLQRSEAGISFPYWQGELGWSSTGARTDSYAGRSATTVFYTPAGGSPVVGYTILSGSALPLPKGAAVEHAGTRYFVLSDHGATVVTWRRDGHTCILAARGVTRGTLLHLAAWA